MTRYTSGDKLNLKLGVESFSEDLLTLDVIGNTDIDGDINVSAGNSITAPEYYGDGSNLTGITLNQVSNAIGGITVQEEGVDVGTTNGITNINFVSSNLTATGSGIGVTIVLTDTPTFSTITGDLTGTATTATKLETSRNFSVSGDVATASAVSFDGTGNVDLTVTLSNNFSANTSGIITASKLSGDGTLITGLSATQVGAMANVVSDTTPELGGDLDLNSNNITGTGDINITGDISATSFSGDGSGVTGVITATNANNIEVNQNSGNTFKNVVFVDGVDGNLKPQVTSSIQVQASTGILTATKLSGDGTLITGLSATQVGAMANLVSDTSPQLGGDLDLNGFDITGTGNINITGVVTATKFSGNGSELTNLTAGQVGALAGLTIREENSLVGSEGAVGDINFIGNYITATASGVGATITLSDITLGTDTTGDYVQSISGTANEISITGGSGEGSSPQIGLPNNVTIGNNLSVSGNLNVTGVLTYEDVTNVDSIGIVTARSGIDAEGDINVSAGNSITAPAYYGDGSGLTGLSAGQVSGAMSSLINDTTPQLGGDLDLNGFDITGTGNANITGVVTATSFDGTLATSDLSGTITNSQLAGSIANSKLVNSSVSYGGVAVNLGGSNAQPAFDLTNATNYPYSSLTGTPTIPTNNNQLTNGAGYITSSGSISGNAASADTVDVTLTGTNASYNVLFATGGNNETVRYDGGITYNPNNNLFTVTNGTIRAGGTSTFSGNGSNLTNIPYSSLTGTPTIPSATSDLTNDSGFITSSSSITGNAATATKAFKLDIIGSGNTTNIRYPILSSATSGQSSPIVDQQISYNCNTNTLTAGVFSGSGASLTNIPYSSLTGTPTIPSATSDLTNDSGFITNITSQTDPKYLRSNANDTFTGTITGNTLLLGGSQITSSSAVLQVNGFMRTGNIILHEGGNTPTAGADGTISNNSGNLEWKGNRVLTVADEGSGNGLDADTLDGENLVDNAATANTVAGRNGSGDIFARLIRQTYGNQSTISGGLVFRVNNSNDNYLRVCNSTSAIRTFLNVPTRTGGNASGNWGINITGNAATVSVTSITSGATERPVYFNDGTTTSGNGVLRMDGSANGMRYRADQNRLLLSNLTVANAVTGDLNGNATTATTASKVDVSSITSGATERRVYFNDGSTSSGGNVVRMDGSANGMRYRADQNRLLLSNLSVTNAVVGDLNGTATNATNVNLRARNNSTGTHYITFGTAATGNQRLNTDTGLTYNSSTNTVTATTFSGNLSGNAATASHWVSPITLTLAGDVTGSGTFNGQTDITFTATVNNDSHTHDTRYVRLTTNQTISGTKTFSNTISGSINGSSASCTGNAASATNATNVNLRSRNTANATHYVTFGTGTSGNQRINTDSSFTYNPYTNVLTSGTFSGSGASLTSLPAGQLTGTIADARLPNSISSNITGNAASADTVDVTLTGTNTSYSVLFATGGSNQTVRYDGGITYNPSSNTLTVTNGTIQAGGTSTFSGSGASLTSLPAGQLTGTIADARLPGTISSNITGSSASCTGNSATATKVQCNVSTDTSVNVLFSNNATSGTKSPIFSTLITGNLNTGRINVSQFKVLDLAGTGNRAVYSNQNGILTNSSSDETLKTNVTSMSTQYDIVKQLNPVTYNWIDTEKLGTQQEIGFIAQQMQTHVPQVVGTNNDDTLTIDYPKLTAVLTKALQESIAKIESLEARITALESN